MRARRDAALTGLADRLGGPVETALILGSGLGGLASQVTDAVAVPFAEIPGMAISTAPGHAGRLVAGSLFGHRCALMQGRVHLYEGRSAAEVALPVYLLAGLGARRLIVTNAAGALNPDFVPGDVMLIEDHLNLTGCSPLTGPPEAELGPRFPDMSRAYDPALRTAALSVGEPLRRGVYAGLRGPEFETSAERRYLRAAGADAVGMSTVVEVIAAAHVGLPVLGLSAITNAATGGPDQAPDTAEAVLVQAAACGERIEALLARLLPML